MARRSSHAKRPAPRKPAEPARSADPAGPTGHARRARPRLWLYAAAIALLGTLAYWNSLDGAFVLDDYISLVENPDIRRIWSLSSLRSSWGESALLGRPLVTFTFAINYAIGGLNVFGYHVGNIAVHILCALALFGLIRRVRHSATFAFACASLWLLHPLNTEVVDYISQRTESMMALFYLLTVYASVRAHAATRPTPWLVAAVVASALGTACKQSMVTVPLAVVLVDCTLFFASPREAFRRRWRFYAAIAAASWLVVSLTLLAGPPARSVGFASGPSPWVYLLNQSVIITRYLALTVWPRGLIADYGYPLPLTLMDVAPQMLFVAGLLALTVVALRYRPQLGLLGAWVYLTLAMTSSVAPIANEVGAERRMYLPLAALVVLGLSPFARLSDHITRTRPALSRTAAIAGIGLWAGAAALLAAGTIGRNRDYSSALRLAQTSFERRPSGYTRHGLAVELIHAGRRDEARGLLREAIRDDPRAHYTYGMLLFDDGRLREAREQLEEFLRLRPLLVEAVAARATIGRTLVAEGRLDAAADEFQQVLRMQPSYADAHLGLGNIQLAQQRFDEAVVEFRRYFAKGGRSEEAWNRFGIALWRTGRPDLAAQAFRRAIDVNPQSGDAHRNLAAMLLERQESDREALRYARRAVELLPADPLSHDLLGVALGAQGRLDEAIDHFRESLRINPSDAEAQEHLGQALRARGR
jgi:tetratricopeptide (TPR) repeat protein